MTVYVVVIQDEFGDSNSIHAVYSSEAQAKEACQELESRLSDDLIVTYEAHEVEE